MMKMQNEYQELQKNNLTKKYNTDAGLDIKSPHNFWIPAKGKSIVYTGLRVTIPSGYVGLIKGRSSLAVKHDIECSNAGVIDAGYRGRISVLLRNFGEKAYYVKAGDRIAQLLTIPVNLSRYTECTELPDSERGSGGFGSTGK